MHLIAIFNNLMEPDSSQNCIMKGQKVTVKDVKGKFLRDIRKKKPLYHGSGYPQGGLSREAVETVFADIQNSTFHRPEQPDLTSSLHMHRAGRTCRESFQPKFFHISACIHKMYINQLLFYYCILTLNPDAMT